MKDYKLEDFPLGTPVYHKSNTDILMIVIDLNKNEVTCRWVDKKGTKVKEDFMFFELLVASDYDDDNGFSIDVV